MRAAQVPTRGVCVASLNDRALVIGVDRLDYSKGLPNRFEAVGRLLDKYPEHRRQVSFLQIAAALARGRRGLTSGCDAQLDRAVGRDQRPVRPSPTGRRCAT